MNKRALTKALKGWADAHHSEGWSARRIAAHFAQGDKVPSKLREPLHALALACLACETAETAPPGTPSYPELYRSREKAFIAFADAAARHFQGKRRVTEDADSMVLRTASAALLAPAESIINTPRFREPEES